MSTPAGGAEAEGSPREQPTLVSGSKMPSFASSRVPPAAAAPSALPVIPAAALPVVPAWGNKDGTVSPVNDAAGNKAGVLVPRAPPSLPAIDDGPKQAKYATFTKYVPGQGRTKTEALFVPGGVSVSKVKLLDLIQKTWKLPMPNLLISCDAGMAHPTTLATPELAMLEQFDKWVFAADKHVRRGADVAFTPGSSTAATPRNPPDQGAGIIPTKDAPPSPPSSPPAARGGSRARISPHDDAPRQPPSAGTLNIMQKLLFQKLRTVFAAIVESAAMSNNWIVIDRTAGKSPTAEYLLELALAQASQQPTVVIIDSEDRLQGYHSERAAEQAKLLRNLKSKASPLGSDQTGGVETLEWLYHPSEFLEPHAFNHIPLPRKPEPIHVDPETGEVFEEMVWWYHYLQTFNSSGTHYIILEKGEDGFDLSSTVGPLGFVVAHGGGLMYERLSSRIQTGSPLVMLYNSGGITQCFGSLLKAMVKNPTMEPEQLLDLLEVPSRKHWAKTIGMPEIMMLKELFSRAPGLFQKTIVTVDLLTDSAEDVLQTLTAAFEGQAGVPELGLGNAESMVVTSAWRRATVLHQNAQRFKKRADIIQYLYFLLTLAATVLTVFYSDIQLRIQSLNSTTGVYDEVTASFDLLTTLSNSIETAVIIVPIIIGLLVSTRSRLRSREKWTACLSASHAIVSEIFAYRLRTLDYDAVPNQSDDEDGGDEATKISATARAKELRSRFVGVISDLFTAALEGEVAKGGSLQHSGSLSSSTDPERFNDWLLGYYNTQLYGKTKGFAAAVFGQKDDSSADKKVADLDDLISPINLGVYMEFRARKISIYLENRAPILSRQLQTLEFFANLMNAVSAVLALVGLTQWVAISVAFSTLIFSAIEYWSLHEQTSANNSALTQVHNLLTWWQSLSMIDRRTRSARTRAVTILEGAMLSSVAANTAAPKASKDEKKEGEDSPA